MVEEMSALTGKSRVEVIESALEVCRHRERMRLFNKGYRNLRRNKATWAEEQEERKNLEGTLADGFEEK
jgi:hypothetical protein